MKPFVVRLEPTQFDRDASATPGPDDLARLRNTWNAWNGKAKRLLDQESRIENLFWRRWHMENRQPTATYGLYSAAEPSGLMQVDGNAEDGRKATQDLEAFLRNTLQAAQPSTNPMPPQVPLSQPPFGNSPADPPHSLPHPQYQPSPLVAPRPQRHAYNPSPEWGYASLPSVSQPVPPSLDGANPQSRIIATPSWTALFSDPTQQPPYIPPAIPQFYPPPAVPPLIPPTATPEQPFAHPNPYPFAAPPPPLAHPMPSPSFTLPPSATLFSDLPSALSSAPPTAAPPAFFSSYGMYQPVIAPYPRFLTPSPEPSVLGELELELGPGAGEFDHSDTTPLANGPGAGLADSDDPDMDRVWKDLESDTNVSAPKRDPFEGMSLAQMRSRANSLEAVDREAARFEAYGVGAGLSASDRAAMEVAESANRAAGTKAKGKRKSESNGGGGKKTRGGMEAAPPAPAAIDSAAANDFGGLGTTKPATGGKKNRNPHSTQLPGNGQRRQQKEEAGEGHQGPVCSHCGSITTPLWRRGPDDELLCNACGLYLKLHSKPRPKAFGKNAGSKRVMNGAAAQAAASGVPPSCNNCGATSTPMWRKDQEGRLCCNACSLYYKLHKVARPASLAQKRAAAAAAKANLAAAAANSSNANSGASSPEDRPASASTDNTLPAPSTSTSATPNLCTAEAPTQGAMLPPMTTLQPAVMPPPHPTTVQSSLPPATTLAPPTWPLHPVQTSPHGESVPLPPDQQPKYQLPPQPSAAPFAQTQWGALAYSLVSAAAEEAGQSSSGPPASGAAP
ncbi:hypothetical protein JCM1841_002589 [Sporobolomyces salmonicolor]